MIRCAFITETPVSYRAGWFEHLSRSADLDLQVIYLSTSQPDRPWETQALDADFVSVSQAMNLGSTSRGHFPRLSPGLVGHLRRLEPDVVVIPGWAHPAAWQARAWCRRRRVPVAVMGETFQRQAETRVPPAVTTALRRKMLRSAAVGFPVGSRAASYFTSEGARASHLVHANTCDSSAIAEQTASVRRTASPSVLYVGRLMDHKGSGLLPDIATELVRTGIEVTIVGDGPDRANIEQLASDQTGVDYLGPVEPRRVHSLMAAAHVCIVPSSKEPWGVVVHESLAAGTPVVASEAVGSAADLIVSPSVGAVVPLDPASFVRECHRLIAAEDATYACRAAGLAISYETAAEELVAGLEMALRTHRSTRRR